MYKRQLLKSLPALESLHLPPSSLTLSELEHEQLRELALFRYDIGHNGRPSDPHERAEILPPPRGSGLTFLSRTRLPRLEKLVIDFTYYWHVPWEAADFQALAEANLPALRSLELTCIPSVAQVLLHLVNACWLGSIETLTLDEFSLDAAAVDILVKMRPKLARLRELRASYCGSEALSAQLREAYPFAIVKW